MRVPPAELGERARERFGGELRRAGSFAQLCMLGAQACLDAADVPGEPPAARAGSVGVLWNSSRGPVGAVQAALAEMRRGEPVMPFSFVALQPHLAATLLAQRSVPVARAAFVRLEDGGWPWLLAQASAWLASCDQVLLGWVEEGDAAGGAHQSDWCVLQRRPARVSCEALRETKGALPATGADWLARVTAWLASPREPLALRGSGEAWRFTCAA